MMTATAMMIPVEMYFRYCFIRRRLSDWNEYCSDDDCEDDSQGEEDQRWIEKVSRQPVTIKQSGNGQSSDCTNYSGDD